MRAWGEACDWRGYDPYDALNSPLAAVLTLNTSVGRRAMTQAVKVSPVNLRPLLRIRPEWNPKAIALVASAYARLAAAGDPTARPEAERRLSWLLDNHIGDEHGLAWSYHFPVQTRFFFYGRDTPNTISTSFVAHAFLDAAELLEEERWSDAAHRASSFLLRQMLAENDGRAYFRYLPDAAAVIHNANLLACGVVARAAALFDDDELFEQARPAIARSVAAQREDGSWPYSEGPRGEWVDNFHTAYVLESLAYCERLDASVGEPLERGLEYWERELFLPDGTPKYLSDGIYPIDAHCFASAIDAWLAVAGRWSGAFARATRTARRLVEDMLEPAGYVSFQRTRLWRNRVPFVRWTTAPSFRALAGLMLASARRATPARLYARLD